MKLREYFMYSEGDKTFTVHKDKNAYKATYSVCMFIRVTSNHAVSHRVTCHTRKEAKEKLLSLLRLYTSLTKEEIRNL